MVDSLFLSLQNDLTSEYFLIEIFQRLSRDSIVLIINAVNASYFQQQQLTSTKVSHSRILEKGVFKILNGISEQLPHWLYSHTRISKDISAMNQLHLL